MTEPASRDVLTKQQRPWANSYNGRTFLKKSIPTPDSSSNRLLHAPNRFNHPPIRDYNAKRKSMLSYDCITAYICSCFEREGLGSPSFQLKVSRLCMTALQDVMSYMSGATARRTHHYDTQRTIAAQQLQPTASNSQVRLSNVSYTLR